MVNNWYTIHVFEGGGGFTVYEWEVGNPDGDGALHACSEQCVATLLSKWMSGTIWTSLPARS